MPRPKSATESSISPYCLFNINIHGCVTLFNKDLQPPPRYLKGNKIVIFIWYTNLLYSQANAKFSLRFFTQWALFIITSIQINDAECTVILCWGGNYCFLKGNPKTVLPPNHMTAGEGTEPHVSKKNVRHTQTPRSSLVIVSMELL